MVKLFRIFFFILITLNAVTVRASDTLRIGLALPYNTLDPAQYIDISSIFVASQIFEPLLRIGPYGELIPWLADSWVVSEDRKTYAFQLKKNIRFASGKPLACNDVKYSFARTILTRLDRLTFLKELVGVKNISLDNLDNWAGFRCMSDVDFVILLETPSSFFIYALSDPALYILPASEDELIRNGSFFTATPYGTGPFFVKKFENNAINLEGNSMHWGKKGDYSSAQLFFADKSGDLEKRDALLFISNDSNRSGNVFYKQSYQLPSIVFLGLNIKKPPWNKIENRRLLIESIDWGLLKKKAYPYSYDPLSGSIIPSGIIGHDRNIKPYAYKPNFQKLAALFRLYPAAKCFAVNTRPDFAALQTSFRDIQAPDILLEPIKNSPNRIVQIIKNGELLTFALRAFMNYPDAFLLLEYFQTGHPMNIFGWSNAEYDNLLMQARRSDGRQEKFDIYSRMSTLLREAYVAVPIQSQMNQEILVSNNIYFDGLVNENIMYYQLSRIKNVKVNQ